jgi:hypothetical protein
MTTTAALASAPCSRNDRLADLRKSVVESVRTAEQQDDVNALRAALAQAFPGSLHLIADG